MGLGHMTANVPQYGVEPPAVGIEKIYTKDELIAGLQADGASKIYVKKDGEEVSVIGHFAEEIRTVTLTPDGMFIDVKKKSTSYPGPEGSTE